MFLLYITTAQSVVADDFDNTAGTDHSLTVAQAQAPQEKNTGPMVGGSGNTEVGGKETLAEVIVTAQKREQDLQNTALAITAITGDALLASGIENGLDLQLSVPSMSMGESVAGSVYVTMRGIGMGNIYAGGDPGVPIHIDGHYIQSSNYILRDFLDIERVEVLRGPQGTLYGRNAVGGSINIITKRPTESFEASMSLDVGNYDRRLLQAMISGPLTDRLRGRLAASYENRDGFVENVSSAGEDDLLDSSYVSVRGTLEYDLTDDIQLTLAAYGFDDSSLSLGPQRINEYSPAGVMGPFVNYWIANDAGSNITVSDPWKVRQNSTRDDSNRAKGAALDVDWDIGSVLFRSLSSYNDSEQDIGPVDFDSSDVVTQHIDITTWYETFSQEFQLLSNKDSRAQWILGLFYYNEDSFFGEVYDWDSFFVPDGSKSTFEDGTRVNAESLGLFGQIDYPISDDVSVVGGLRYNRDRKSAYSTLLIPEFGLVGPASIVTDDSEDWSKVTGKIGLNYQINDDAMAYASYSTGYKSGGYNPAQATPYDPENVEAYEAGLKGLWLDRTIQTNLSAYYYEYSDKQESRRDAQGITGLENAAAATIWGVELEASVKPIADFLIQASVSYLNTEYDEFDTSDFANPGLGVQDLSGNSLVRAPEWKLYLGLQYEWELGATGQLVARLDTSWTDRQYASAFNRPRDVMDSYGRSNALLQWNSENRSWQAALYVQNLEDEDALVSIDHTGPAVGFGAFGQYLPPRTYGVRITRQF